MATHGKLKLTLPDDRTILFTRAFDAPRELVWRALSEPALLRKWMYCPDDWTMTTCDDDVRVGGGFRWAWSGPNGFQMTMHGTYREVVRPERMVRTETFDTGCPAQAGEQVVTLVLAETAGKTSMTLTVRYPTKDARDAAQKSGMEHGMAVGYDQLDGLLAGPTLRKPR